MDFEPQHTAVAFPRGVLRCRNQSRRNPSTGAMWRNRNGVKPRDPAVGAKQDHGDTGDRAIGLPDHHGSARRDEEPPEAAARHPVGFKHAVFKIMERIAVRQSGAANMNLMR